jgi:hypothetical protein
MQNAKFAQLFQLQRAINAMVQTEFWQVLAPAIQQVFTILLLPESPLLIIARHAKILSANLACTVPHLASSAMAQIEISQTAAFASMAIMTHFRLVMLRHTTAYVARSAPA